MRQLEALGLAEHVPHHGAKVMRPRRRGAARALLDPARARGHGGAARGRALRAGRRRGRARAPRPRTTRRGSAATSARRCARTASFHFALYEAARSAWLAAPDPARRGTRASATGPVLLAKGAVQDRHEELDVELLDACAAHDPDRAAQALHDHLELATRHLRRRAQGPVDLRVLTAARPARQSATGVACSAALHEPSADARRQRAATAAASAAPARRACPSRRRGPGPGQVLAPMCQRRSTGVAWPGLRANGRQRKFWSSESAPPYGSPCRRFTFSRSRSAGESTTRCSDARLEVRDVPREPRLDAVRVALAQPLRPRAVADVELAGGVALDVPRQLLELDPEQPLARRARATGRSSAAGRRRSSPPPAAGRAPPRSPRARRRRARA